MLERSARRAAEKAARLGDLEEDLAAQADTSIELRHRMWLLYLIIQNSDLVS
jgi:hypothetical protein